MPAADRELRSAEFTEILARSFRNAGWRVERPRRDGDASVDLVLSGTDTKYLVQLMVSSEGRRDRLIPLLSQAILEVRTSAHQFPTSAVPVAVVAAGHIPASVAGQIKEFANRFAPEVGVGVIDAEGLRSFTGFGLEKLDAQPARRRVLDAAQSHRMPELFSDLNQWMLKIIVGQGLPEELITVPRDPIRNASQLAKVADVSIMSASRFLKQLSGRGSLDKSEDLLHILRVEELFDLWISANREAAKEVPARWILKKGPGQLQSTLREYAALPVLKKAIKSRPRCCLALFAAADALGYGFVQGVPPRIYLERLTLDALGLLGLAVDHSGRPPDVYLRIPANPETIFLPRVMRDGVPISDILQVWLDASTHPARGKEQGLEIRRRVLKPLFRTHR